MLFMIIRKDDALTESGTLPGPQMLEAMGRYRDELAAAGVYRGGDGLLPSALGAKLRYSQGRTTVTDGPFTDAKEVIAGFVLLETGSLTEAVRWARRCPSLAGGDAEIEIRQLAEAAHFPPEAQPALARMPWSTVSAQAITRIGDIA
ncbi:YciI family protein [Solimonas sp. K1W22B-7]|uniref:YciI family protein n=1 Tax=Solimonas sp. K1W22B-7 TaxID=2303331 RepID=UPI000E330E08|nr:YciI family protein [Solimonas sp. K1W22B-7]AXQ30115.1 YciI family protein [Solimonas sp. K1W22B-7]